MDLQTVATWLLFSGQQVSSLDELFAQQFWNGVKMKDYPNVEDYLLGVDRVSESYATLMPKYQNHPKTLFILDPPYLFIEQNAYKQGFDLISFLTMMEMVHVPFIIFYSTKLEIVNYINFLIEQKRGNYEVFSNCQRISINACLNYSAKYQDNIIFKF